MAKKSRKKIGLAFYSGFKLICDAPGKKSPIHTCTYLSYRIAVRIFILFSVPMVIRDRRSSTIRFRVIKIGGQRGGWGGRDRLGVNRRGHRRRRNICRRLDFFWIRWWSWKEKSKWLSSPRPGSSFPNYKKTLEYTQRIATQYPHLCRLTSTILNFAKIDRLCFLFVPFSWSIFFRECAQYSMMLRSEQFLWKETCVVTLTQYSV